MRKIMKRVGASIAATSAVVAMVAGPAAVAQAESGVNLGTTATLVAKGAAALVPVQATCGDAVFPSTSIVMVSLSERAGNRLVVGSGSESVTCNGTPQTVQVLVRAQDAPFKPGTALATAGMFFCGPSCTPDTGEIRIRNRPPLTASRSGTVVPG